MTATLQDLCPFRAAPRTFQLSFLAVFFYSPPCLARGKNRLQYVGEISLFHFISGVSNQKCVTKNMHEEDVSRKIRLDSKRRMYTRRHTLNPYGRCNARPNHDPHSISQSNVHVPPLMERVHERERINWSEEFMIQRSLSTCITFANRDNSDTGLLDFPMRR